MRKEWKLGKQVDKQLCDDLAYYMLEHEYSQNHKSRGTYTSIIHTLGRNGIYTYEDLKGCCKSSKNWYKDFRTFGSSRALIVENFIRHKEGLPLLNTDEIDKLQDQINDIKRELRIKQKELEVLYERSEIR